MDIMKMVNLMDLGKNIGLMGSYLGRETIKLMEKGMGYVRFIIPMASYITLIIIYELIHEYVLLVR